MDAIDFRNKLRAGDQLIGTLLVAQTPFWPKILGDCGLGFVFIGTEHIAIGRESLSWMSRTYSAMGLPPLVRVTSPNPYDVTVAYDDGASGVVAPYLEEVAEATQLIAAARFRPLKGKRVANGQANPPLADPLDTYIAKNTAGNTLMVNIESVPAMENLDAILEVEGIDGVLIGPHDLSCSLGLPEQYDHPEFLKATETILTQARNAGIGAGVHYWGTTDESTRLIGMGANLFIHKADAIFLREGLQREVGALRAALGSPDDAEPGDSKGEVNI